MPKSIVLTLTDKEREYLVSLSKTRTIQAQVVDRARMLLWKERGLSNAAIANGLDINIKSVNLCLEKYFEAGVEEALFDKQRDGRPAEITADAVAWMTDIACQRPADLGYSQELWTLHNLHQHIQSHAEEAGYLRLKTITKARIQQILKQSAIKPFKIKYYCERRDPDFESKMHDVLLIYKQVELQFDDNGDIIIPEDGILTVTLSYDEKPGIQAVANTSDDLRPTAQNGAVFRDYEYKRLGTVSLLAAIDLLTGEAIPLISDTHKSSDFITFLKMLDTKYPSEHKIRIILDNHSAHTSKETRNFLATMPEGRFEFIFTPKHGSWLNMIESFFGKMTKQMLRGIRVKTKQELVDRIYQYFTEVNREPVIFRWTYKMDEVQSEIGNV